jgi:hypothetical protein
MSLHNRVTSNCISLIQENNGSFLAKEKKDNNNEGYHGKLTREAPVPTAKSFAPFLCKEATAVS